MFQNSSSNIDELTDVVSSYIRFCTDSVIPSKEITIFPNTKPWISKDIKNLLLKKKYAFNHGDTLLERESKKEVRAEIKKAKLRYKDKIEAELSSNNSKRAWNGMKTMTGTQTKNNKKVTLDGYTSDQPLANDLNSFYLRFDNYDFTAQMNELREKTTSSPSFDIDADKVANLFRRSKKKSPGPDNICGWILKTCANQLCNIFQYIFTLSLTLQKIPKLWKHSIVVPIPKCNNPKVLNDFRPVALTSLVMKSFERLIKSEILLQVEEQLDHLQFAYRPGRGVEDAAVTLLNLLFKHLETPKSHARLLFIDFSSAFNTIQPSLLVEKLIHDFKLDLNLIGWILDFLTNRSQCVRVNGALSNLLFSSTGSPQGCCLSDLFFILYTNNCLSNHANRYILKYADDSIIVSLLKGENQAHGPVVDDFIAWCDQSFLHLNVSKTKDMIIDFRKSPPNTLPTIMKGANIDIVDSYKYLGIIMDNKLSFEPHVDATCKKVQQRLFFLRKMNSFNVSSEMMTLFYRSFIQSVLTFCSIAWFGNVNLSNKNRLNSLVKISSKISRCNQTSLYEIYNKQVLRKALTILDCENHPLQLEFEPLPSGRRFRAPARCTKRFQVSFIPSAIKEQLSG